MSQSNSTPRMTGWILLGLFLCININYAVTAKYQAQLLFQIFLPLMTAIVAHRYGERVFAVLTILAIPGMIEIGWSLTDRMSIYYGISSLAFLVSTGTAIAFCRPAISFSKTKLLHDRFRWTRWLVLAAVWLMLIHYVSFEREISDDLYLETNIGAIVFIVLLALSVNWSNFTAVFRVLILTSKRRWANRLRATIWILLAVAVVLNVGWDFDYVFMVGFGFADATSILLFAVLAVSALGKLDWRIAVVAVIAIIISEELTEPLYDWIESTMALHVPPVESGGSATDGGLEDIVVSGAQIRGGGNFFGHFNWFALSSSLCFGLLGAAVAPAWQRRSPEALESRHTAIYLTSAVVATFASVPLGLYGFDYAHYLVLMTAGLLMGYRWRYRALVLAPLVLVFAFLTFGFAFAVSFNDIPSALSAIDIIFVVFPATFIGVLLNRYRPATDGTTTFGEASGR